MIFDYNLVTKIVLTIPRLKKFEFGMIPSLFRSNLESIDHGVFDKNSCSSQSLTVGDSWDYDISTKTTQSWSENLDYSFSEDTEIVQPERIRVSVMGTPFMIEPHVFETLSRLPWQSDHQGSYCLNTSPELFEILLDYLVYHSLPDKMSKNDIEELEPMAIVMGLDDLENHLQIMQKKPSWRTSRRLGIGEPMQRDADKEHLLTRGICQKTPAKERTNLLSSFWGNIRNKHERTILESDRLT